MAVIKALPSLVRKQFKAAQDSGDLTFYATRVSILQCQGLPFQLRYSPALANKPKSHKSPNSKPVDPFENPPAGLFITDLPPSHFLVLNKFPVIPDHFILATKDFKLQTDFLEDVDLGAAYSCLKSYIENGEELFGFFNSGEHSGASQPHRHIQFLPVESMRSGIEKGMNWSVLADRLGGGSHPELPFAYFSSALPENVSPQQLHIIYISLHEQASRAVQQSQQEPVSHGAEQPLDISYNLGFTDKVMVLCPRKSEGMKIQSDNGGAIGPIALNGTVLGGTLLVKSEEEWNALCSDESKLKDILYAIGIPSSASEREGRL